MILTNNEDIIKKINKNVFPGIQGGPLEHIIAAKGICFEEAMTDEFKQYANQVVNNSIAFARRFNQLGYKIVSGGTDNHLFILDVYHTLGLTGKQVEEALDSINITVNKNQIWKDELPPLQSSGVRIGTAAMTTKCWREDDFIELANYINSFLIDVKNLEADEERIQYFKDSVQDLINKER